MNALAAPARAVPNPAERHAGPARDRRAARVMGTLFLVATAAGLVSVALSQPALAGDDLLADVAAGRGRLLLSVLAVLVMAAAVVGVAAAAYPVLRRRSPGLAVGYVAARTAEGVVMAIGAIALLALVVLADEASGATGAAAEQLGVVGTVLASVREWGAAAVLDTAVFPVGAMLLYGVLYRGRLVPRWLAGWGFAGAVLYLAGGVLLLLDQITSTSAPLVLSNAPLGLNELVLAVWLIVRGFDTAGSRAAGDVEDAR